MGGEFMPKLSNLAEMCQKVQVSEEDGRKLKTLHSELNLWGLGLSLVWGGLLSLDLRNFLMKEKAMILKVFRAKYHCLSALGLGFVYFYVDFEKGDKAIDILSKYDLRFRSLKHPNNAF